MGPNPLSVSETEGVRVDKKYGVAISLSGLLLITQLSVAGTTRDEIIQKLNELPKRDGQIVQHLAAGVLPIAIEDGRAFFLMGKLRKTDPKKIQWNDTYSTFSGGRAKNEIGKEVEFTQSEIDHEFSNPIATAVRETYQETNGLFASREEIENWILSENTVRVTNNSWNPVDRPAVPVPTYIFFVQKTSIDLIYKDDGKKEIKQIDWVPAELVFQALDGKIAKDLKNLSLSNGMVLAEYCARTLLVNEETIKTMIEKAIRN